MKQRTFNSSAHHKSFNNKAIIKSRSFFHSKHESSKLISIDAFPSKEHFEALHTDQQTALWITIRKWVIDNLNNGTFSQGDYFPKDQEIANNFGVSLKAIESCLNMLILTDGLLQRCKGQPTVLMKPTTLQEIKKIEFLSETSDIPLEFRLYTTYHRAVYAWSKYIAQNNISGEIKLKDLIPQIKEAFKLPDYGSLSGADSVLIWPVIKFFSLPVVNSIESTEGKRGFYSIHNMPKLDPNLISLVPPSRTPADVILCEFLVPLIRSMIQQGKSGNPLPTTRELEKQISEKLVPFGYGVSKTLTGTVYRRLEDLKIIEPTYTTTIHGGEPRFHIRKDLDKSNLRNLLSNISPWPFQSWTIKLLNPRPETQQFINETLIKM
ncbi:MAG: hypothetical protein SFU25_02785 [Candidatus Caenarcaniphilales bacterium]|nr:hypothetical protein [Candidatus Caenarcaniphilales bacterium]